ncbi:MAG: aspartate/glutamate racemase family protein, partial [Gammaproteobacteria bacterium]|nr:aspartate/glutamate racemase family protein [Gammaproteobacteria bacterium]
ADRHGLEVLVPEAAEREVVHRIIYGELCQWKISADSRRLYLDIIAGLAARGAGAVILGCTEIALLVRQEHTPVPLYDTTAIHARQAVDRALER